MPPSLRCRHYRSHEPMAVGSVAGAVPVVEAAAELEPGDPTDLLTPLFVDLQISGLGGVDFSNAAEPTPAAVRAVARTLWGQGIGYLLPTVLTGGLDDLRRNFEVPAESCRDPQLATSIPAFHLEGPHISPDDGPRGAHRLKHVQPPSWAEFEALQEVAEGRIGLVALAPEQERAIPAIGHTNASTRELGSAVEAGAVLSTHLGNGSHAEIRRHADIELDVFSPESFTILRWGEGRHEVVTTVVAGQVRHPLSAQDALPS
ncbi:MAG: hypothetical protein OXM87_11155 [Truepera sp.]|nr:hypothetical protein [Truepera sp.]